MRNNRRIIVCILLTSIILSTSIVYAQDFQDIKGTKYEAAVAYLKAKGIMKGYPDNTFKPDSLINRAEFAVISVLTKELSGAAVKAEASSRFRDVSNEHWASKYIAVATDAGLISGYGNGIFGIDDNITYSAAVTILVRMLGMGPEVDKMGEWPTNYIMYARDIGLLKNVDMGDWLALKFFSTHSNYLEHDEENFDPENRVYKTEFERGYYSQCIWWDLTIEFPPLDRDIDFPIEFKYFRKSGKVLWGDHTIQARAKFQGLCPYSFLSQKAGVALIRL